MTATKILVAAALLGVGCVANEQPELEAGNPGPKADGADEDGADAPRGFDVSDVTVLFPLEDSRPVPALDLTDPRLQITDTIFTDALQGLAADDEYPFDAVSMITQTDRSDWFIVAARYDPCANAGPTHDPSTGTLDPSVGDECIQLVRLVAQPFLDEIGFDADAGLHLIYAAGLGVPGPDDPNVGVLRRWSSLAHEFGVPTAGVPLGVHPALADGVERGDDAFATSVADGIGEMLGRARLSAIAATSLMQVNEVLTAEGGAVWAFTNGRVDGGRWRKEPLELDFALGDEIVTRSKDFVVCTRPGCNKRVCVEFEGSEVCETIVPADPALPGLESVSFPATDENLASWAHNAHRIDDPLAFEIPELACVDCHLTRGTYPRFGVHSSPERRTPPAGITGYADCRTLRPGTWNTRNLGYHERVATVSTRTVLETAFVADFLNQRVLGAPNPGLDCTLADEEVWECLVHEGECTRQDGGQHTQDCLSACDGAP